MIDLIALLIAESKKLGYKTLLIVGIIRSENTAWNQMRSTDYSEAIVLEKLLKTNYNK